ncbi:MAG: DUF58 domain-containing protein [Candidatus Limnocylindria bacterium]|nr:DUF58 domain-containing protein [Chloroflexota bacterium]MDQ3399552.1 DUF58 domain-containing protein [Chloroflexota bacterium]
MNQRPVGAFPGLAVVVLVVTAAVTRAPAIIVAAAGAVVAWAVVFVTGRLALVGVEATVELDPVRLQAGETLTAVVTVVNRKPIPLPWLDLRLALPDGVEAAGVAPGSPRQHVGAGFAPRGHERAVLRFPLLAPQRGAYAIGPLRMRAGDWLGFSWVERTIVADAQAVVYPAPIALRDRHRPSLRPIAETAVRRGLLPDPLRFRGVRDHRVGDPRKEIHWKASARLRDLQTKIYEPATSLDAIFLLNVASYEQFWVQADPEATEVVISATAELARIAAEAGRQVGLVTNGLDNLTHERPRSALGRGPRPLRRTLDILARLGPYAAASAEAVFLRERGRLPWGATLIVVTPRLGPELASACVSLRRSGHRVLALSITPPLPMVSGQLRQHDITLDDLGPSRWREVS